MTDDLRLSVAQYRRPDSRLEQSPYPPRSNAGDASSDLSVGSSAHLDNSTSVDSTVHPVAHAADDDDAPELATYETRQVGWLRALVFGSLATAAVGVSAVIYFSTVRSERNEFELRFSDHSSTIIDSFRTNLREGIAAVDAMAVSMLSYADAVDAQWPVLTVPDFEKRAATTRKSGMFSAIALLPYVDDDARTAYEASLLDHGVYQWMADGLAYETRTGQAQWEFGTFADSHTQSNGNRRRLILPRAHAPSAGHRETSVEQQRLLQQATDADPDATAEAETDADIPAPVVVEDFVWTIDENQQTLPVPTDSGPYLPIWQHSPVDVFTNLDILRDPSLGPDVRIALETQRLTFSNTYFLNTAVVDASRVYQSAPASSIVYPLLRFDENDRPVQLRGMIVPTFFWDAYMQIQKLPSAADSIYIVLHNECGQSFTFRVDHGDVVFFAEGDRHDSQFDDMEELFQLSDFFEQETIGVGQVQFNSDQCPYSIHIYPSETMRDRYFTSDPYIYTVLVFVAFVVTSVIFVGYDCIVERRQKVVMHTATKSHAIVSSLFPKNVRKRLLDDGSQRNETNNMFTTDQLIFGPFATQRAKLKNFVNSRGTDTYNVPENNAQESKPIADLFPNATVLFADIAGFTAWSSTREPSQVFRLLESLYGAFDKLADRKKVFKVETIGDSYLAVTGLPDPQKDHALIMAKFAAGVLHKMAHITRELERELGPDTTELAMRIGIHSGPVTAGVLRGQKSRFQLFGDTVNTASRMESTGCPNRIQCSQETASLLIESGRGQWIRTREDLIEAKGKGTIQTFWVQPKVGGHSVASVEHAPTPSLHIRSQLSQRAFSSKLNLRKKKMSPHFKRLVDWNVDLLLTLLKRIVAHQMNSKEQRKRRKTMALGQNNKRKNRNAFDDLDFDSGNPRDEYREVIHLPHFEDNVAIQATIDPNEIELKTKVEDQLRDYVMQIASSYRETNHFHNYDHASHVIMSTNKILQRIVAADHIDIARRESTEQVAAQLHNYTYGITSDPLTHFACIFAALIHDVDHPGVPNSQLVKEQDEMAVVYDGKSVAEQNSLDLAWGLLMDIQYKDLRMCLFDSEDAKRRFRQLLVNIVMATDVFDPELKKLRNNRWSKAFAEPAEHPANENGKGIGRLSNLSLGASRKKTANGNLDLSRLGSTEDTDSDNFSTTTSTTPEENRINRMDLKATIVIEHILQAADVSHTMQHWHVYQKWNRRLFFEMYTAYKNGRLDEDPSVNWYKGELWFYDNYIIPLAKKLSECGVFGVSSDEFLNYAKMNRSEWERKGDAIVKALKAEYETMSSATST